MDFFSETPYEEKIPFSLLIGSPEGPNTSPQKQEENPEYLPLGRRLANGIVQLTQGAFSWLAFGPITQGVSLTVKKIGLIEEQSVSAEWLNPVGSNLSSADLQALQHAECPNAMMADLVRRSQTPSIASFTASDVKNSNALSFGILRPLGEELAFRGLLQDVLLKRVTKWAVKKIAPEKEKALDSPAAKVIRVLLSAAAFSAYQLHQTNPSFGAVGSARFVQAFVLGLGLGWLKESSAGLGGSLGLHVAHAFYSLRPLLLSC